MQILIALPFIDEIENALFRKVAGVPLLERVIATASRSGGGRVLLLHPATLPPDRLRSRLNTTLMPQVSIETFVLDTAFEPNDVSAWKTIESHLDSKFLWLPWNYAPDKKALQSLIEVGRKTTVGARLVWPQSGKAGSPEPLAVVYEKLMEAGTLDDYLSEAPLESIPAGRAPGFVVDSRESVRNVEKEMVRRSGKDSDGIYSKANRFLVRPAVRWLSHTPVTPNMVTFSGWISAALSGYAFAQGYWSAYVLGAVLYFVTVLIDEIDGMLARLTFRESAFGCWLETFVDYGSYIFVFGGMTAGLYRQSGFAWLVAGILLLAGTMMSFAVLIRQRKLATDPGRPQEYRVRLHRRLEADSSNVFSRFGRLTEFLCRHGALCYYVLIFTVLGGLKVLFMIAVIGSHLVWMLVLRYNRLFRQPPPQFRPSVS
ncbi:MAG: CDP-alcohol phosphatidyltransferase family protein [Acidobacteria bacterium]|nr:CDP-alcohol phosphatidyltransferase family protein [Acidobacteriota bacterium]